MCDETSHATKTAQGYVK